MCFIIFWYCWVGLLLILVNWFSCNSILHNNQYNNIQVTKMLRKLFPKIEITQPNTES
jgi:hypothetical protein